MSWTILQMSASEKAAWYGAIVATGALLWNIVRDIIRWFRHGPRLKISASQPAHYGPDSFVVEVTNTRPPAAMIESVKLRCFARRWFFFRKEIDHEGAFGLSGSMDFPPNVTIEDAHHWEVHLDPRILLSSMFKAKFTSVNTVCVEIREAHRRRPYRCYPDARRFLAWVGSDATVR